MLSVQNSCIMLVDDDDCYDNDNKVDEHHSDVCVDNLVLHINFY